MSAIPAECNAVSHRSSPFPFCEFTPRPAGTHSTKAEYTPASTPCPRSHRDRKPLKQSTRQSRPENPPNPIRKPTPDRRRQEPAPTVRCSEDGRQGAQNQNGQPERERIFPQTAQNPPGTVACQEERQPQPHGSNQASKARKPESRAPAMARPVSRIQPYRPRTLISRSARSGTLRPCRPVSDTP